MDLKIRPYLLSDYEQISEIMDEAEMLNLPWDSEENFKKKFHKDPFLMPVAEVDNQIVGSMLIMEDGVAGFICRLVVKKEFREQGIGSKMMAYTEELLKNRGITQINLWIDWEDQDLMDFYKNKGYQPAVKRLLMFKEI